MLMCHSPAPVPQPGYYAAILLPVTKSYICRRCIIPINRVGETTGTTIDDAVVRILARFDPDPYVG
jgi:hypothetical protein